MKIATLGLFFVLTACSNQESGNNTIEQGLNKQSSAKTVVVKTDSDLQSFRSLNKGQE